MDRKRYIFPGGNKAKEGPSIPPWLLTLGLSPEQILLWAVMGRCAGPRAIMVGASIDRLARLTGMSHAKTRVVLHSLRKRGLVEQTNGNGRVPEFVFPRHPAMVNHDGHPSGWRDVLDRVDGVDRDDRGHVR